MVALPSAEPFSKQWAWCFSVSGFGTQKAQPFQNKAHLYKPCCSENVHPKLQLLNLTVPDSSEVGEIFIRTLLGYLYLEPSWYLVLQKNLVLKPNVWFILGHIAKRFENTESILRRSLPYICEILRQTKLCHLNSTFISTHKCFFRCTKTSLILFCQNVSALGYG